jgi:4-hydroxy-3-methylbut-2-enyl diphosphate reductase IspH
MKLMKEQRVFLLQTWWKYNKSHTVTAAFTHKYPGVQTPTQQAICNLHARFKDTGNFEDLPQSGRPRLARIL